MFDLFRVFRVFRGLTLDLCSVPIRAIRVSHFCFPLSPFLLLSAEATVKFLLLNQAFWPDVVSTGQHLSDLALGLVERGHEVTVIASRRAYDNPERVFPAHENWRGIHIHRISTTAFGKSAKWRRAADFASFILSCVCRLLTTRKPDVVVALTSPPLISFIGALYARLRGARFVYWVMDLNPDEAIAAGWLREGSLPARLLHWMSRYSLHRADKIIALDRFMQDRILAKGIAPERIAVIPPWAHDDAVTFDAPGRERFRKAHKLDDKFVIMYSGNHSPCHPLDTLLAVARELAHDPRFVFLFVGGGSEFKKIQALAGRPVSPSQPVSVSTPESPTPNLNLNLNPNLNPNPNPASPPPGSPRPSDGRGVRGEGHGCSMLNVECSPDLPPADSPLRPPVPLARRTGEGSGVRAMGARQGEVSPQSEISQPSTLNSQPTPAISHLPSSNLLCLPYQPLNELSASLSAADLHVVVMGNPFVGVVHPCKIYNVLSVGAPVLYLGPKPSHLSELLDALDSPVTACVPHGDVDRCRDQIQRMAALKQRGEPERYASLAHQFSQGALLPRFIAELEAAIVDPN